VSDQPAQPSRSWRERLLSRLTPRLTPRHWLAAARSDIALIVRCHRLILAGERRRASLLFGLVLLGGIVPIAQLWLTREIVNALVGGDTARAMTAGAIAVLAVLLYACVQPYQDVLATQIQDRGIANVDGAIIGAASRLRDLVQISRPEYHDRRDAVIQSSMHFSGAISSASRFLYTSAISLVGVLISLGTLHPLIPLALLGTGLIEHRMWKRQFDLEYRSIRELARPAAEMTYARLVAQMPENAAEVRMFGLGPWLLRRFRHFAALSLKELTAKRREGALWAIGGTAFSIVAVAGSFLYVARQAEGGTLAIGDLALFISGLIQAQGLTRQAYLGVQNLHEIATRSRDLFPFLDGARAEIAVPPEGAGSIPAETPTTGVSLRNVSFTYPHGDQPVLRDLSLDLPAGTVTALVGENGAGKSTLVNLLSRMFDPDAGTIALDGVPFAEYDLTALRERITVVFQDGARLAFTLEDTIAIGDPAFSWGDPDAGRARAREVGDRVGIGTIAARLPKGYGNELTLRFQGGVDLSGGQWQLVGFARGLIRDDAALAMLDEPSSALDPVREAEQIAHIRAFARARRRSVLLISHRLSTVRWADRIAVMEDGTITESGTHETLLAAGGTYADLFRMQASHYCDDPAE
jgi:ATP-binding cassette subfamily B protein